MSAVVKLGAQAGKATSKQDGDNPSPRAILQTELVEKIETMLFTSVQIARQEVIQEMQTILSRTVGAANVNYDKAQANAVAEHDKTIDSLATVSQAVTTYRKSMGPQNHARDALVAECDRLWQFSTASYVRRASLVDEKQEVEAEKAGVVSKTHCTTIQDDGTSVSSDFTPEMRNAEFAALETRFTSIRASYTREKTAIYSEITGKDSVPTTQSTTIMEWPEGDDVQCAQLEKNWINFTKGKEDQLDLVFQAIMRLFVDCIPMGDNRHQFDTCDLVFDDTNAPEMRAHFVKQDLALFKLLMAGLPNNHD